MARSTPLHLHIVGVKFHKQPEEMFVTNSGAYSSFGPQTRVFVDEEDAEVWMDKVRTGYGKMASSVTKYTFSNISSVTRQVLPQVSTSSAPLDVNKTTTNIPHETIAKRRP